jgi:hypothetical protein
MSLGRGYNVKPLGYRGLVDNFETQSVDFVDLVSIKFNLWWIQLYVNVSVRLIEVIFLEK